MCKSMRPPLPTLQQKNCAIYKISGRASCLQDPTVGTIPSYCCQNNGLFWSPHVFQASFQVFGSGSVLDQYSQSCWIQGFGSTSISSRSGSWVLKTNADPDTDPRLDFQEWLLDPVFQIRIHFKRIRILGFENECGSEYGPGSKAWFLRVEKNRNFLYFVSKHFNKHEKN